MKGIFEMQPRLGDEAAPGDGIAEAQDQRLLGLADGEDRRSREDNGRDGNEDDEKAGRALHFDPPLASEFGASCGSGR